MLEVLDNKIYHLIRSNKEMQEERQQAIEDDDYELAQEWADFITENDGVIIKQKDTIIKILTQFLKVGTNLEKEIYPKMKYRSLYMNDK